MKSVNLICKVEIVSEFENVKKKILEFSKNNIICNYEVTICVPYDFEIEDDDVNIIRAEKNQSLESVMNNAILSSKNDYVVCTALNNKNWEHYTIKIVESLSSGVEVCKVSKLFLPKNIFWKILNVIIRIYYMCINSFIISKRTLGATSNDFQGYSQRALLIMRNFKDKMFHFRNEDCFMLLNQKNLFLKKENKSEAIEHLVKKPLSKKQILSFVTMFITILVMVLTFLFMLKFYVKEGAVLKFIILNMIILGLGFSTAFYLFFSDEAKKITM